jgi:hypothetical protein
MTIKTKIFEKVRYHYALTKNFRVRFAKRAIEFRESISREAQRRFLVDNSILMNDLIILDDH